MNSKLNNMKHFILGLMLAFISILNVNAQVYDAGTINDNWYIGGDIGTPVWSNTKSWQVFNPWKDQQLNINLYAGKYLTPYVGLEGGIAGLFNTGSESNWIDGHNLYAGGVLNLSNIFGGYLGKPRKVEVEFMAGPGWYHTYKTGEDLNSISVRNAARIKFNVKKNLSIAVTPEYIFLPRVYDNHRRQHIASLNAGIVYKFNSKRGGFPVHRLYDYDEVAKLNAIIAELKKPRPTVAPTVITNTKYYNNAYSILFEQGSSELGDVSAIANAIKDSKETITIIGGISPEGSEELNKNLALARANAVKDALVKAGIDANRINVTSDYSQQRRATIVVGK